MHVRANLIAFAAILIAVAACTHAAAPAPAPVAERRAMLPPLPQQNDPYFIAGAQRAAAAPLNGRARNVILFVGDGMGIATVTATRIYAGQQQGRDGESYQLAMDMFPHTAFSRTYTHDYQVAESAATAAALMTGVKTRSGVIGLTSEATLGACDSATGHDARTLFEIAEGAGLATGVITTARLTHATPAAAYAHTPHRDWENDAVAARANAAVCPDIARQLIEWPHGDGFEIALGGGRPNFMPSTAADPETPNEAGARADGRDLTAEWVSRAPNRVYVWNAAQLAAAPADARVLGLFSRSHMAYESERASDVAGEPSLAEMTATVIERLSQDSDGFVLLVEGGRIDHAHHAGQAGQALSETAAFDAAVRTALEMTSRQDTLIVVTADHSHTLTISGYAERGNPILGLASEEDEGGVALAEDGLPYTTLGYANGPGSVSPAARADLRGVDTLDLNFRQQALVPLGSETHGGEDVPIYAWGPGDEGFAGTLEQNVVFHLMARALGLH